MNNSNNKNAVQIHNEIFDLNDEVLELIYQIEDNRIINIKEKRDRESSIAQKIMEHEGQIDSDDSKIKNMSDNFTNTKNQNIEENDEYQAYLNFKKKIMDIGLKKLVKKVNAPDINQKVSVYTHENELLSQSLLLSIVSYIRPLYNMGVNISKEENINTNDEDKVQFVKNYFQTTFAAKIKDEIIARYNKEKSAKIAADKDLPEDVRKRMAIFNELVIGHFLLWIHLGFENSPFFEEEFKTIDERLSDYINDFMNKNLEEIFKKISF